MKRLILIVVLVFITFSISCQVVYRGQTTTVQWDAADFEGGDPAQFKYVVSIAPYPSGTEIVLGETSTTEYAITLPSEGSYHVCVINRRTVPGSPPVIMDSDRVWSDVAGYPQPFILVYYPKPGVILKLRVK